MGFKLNDIDFNEVTDGLKLLQNAYPDEVKKFLRKEGTKLKNRTVTQARNDVKIKTGNYFKGIKRGKFYRWEKNGVDTIRVYSGRPAYHGHLLEYGHRIVLPGKIDTGRRTREFHTFQVSAEKYRSVYEDNCEKFAHEVIGKF